MSMNDVCSRTSCPAGPVGAGLPAELRLLYIRVSLKEPNATVNPEAAT